MSDTLVIIQNGAPELLEAAAQGPAGPAGPAGSGEFARDPATTTSKRFGYKGGKFLVNQTTYTIVDGARDFSLASDGQYELFLAASSSAMLASLGISSTPPGCIPMYRLSIAGGVIDMNSIEDLRAVYNTVLPVQETVNVFTKNQSVAPSALISGASINTEASLSNNLRLVLGENATLANPTSMTAGMTLNFEIVQDGTGSRTLAYDSKFKFPGGVVPVLSTAPNAIDLMSCYYDSATDSLLCNLVKGFA